MYTNYSVVLTTTKHQSEAEALAEKILEQKLAACVQIQRIKSFYNWNEKIEHNEEHLLLIKTRASLCSRLSEFIRQNHDYQMPEVVQIPIAGGSPEYLDWINAATSDFQDCE
jgi:periplasmic divalent cation tolerance protein